MMVFIRSFILFTFFGFFLLDIGANRLVANDRDMQELHNNINVVLIAINVLRADHLSCFGYFRKTSPAIDKLAKDSFVFKNAHAQAGYTLPNMMSIITSLYPASHNVLDVYKDRLSTSIKTLAEILKIYEYKTAWFSLLSEAHLSMDAGFGRGFDHKGNLDEKFREKQQLLSWITQNKNRFFLAVNARSTHAPYFPPVKFKTTFQSGEKGEIIENEDEFYQAVYFKMIELINTPGSSLYGIFDKKTVELINNEEFFYSYEKDFEHPSWQRRIDKIRQKIPAEKLYNLTPTEMPVYYSRIDLTDRNNIEYLISLYDECILGVDQLLIKPIISHLKELGIYNNTLIIITADHGESLGEHNILVTFKSVGKR